MGFMEFENELGMGGIFLIFYLVYMLFIIGLSVAQYVLRSVGMYTIAKRRGIRKPWLAWVPIGESWILGSISDQYQYVAKGKVKNKRKSLLVLQIVLYVVTVVFCIAYGVLILQVILAAGAANSSLVESTAIVSALIWLLGLALAVLGISIAAAIIWYMALYDLFRSCEPGNAGLYLVLSIVFGITQPIFLFVCRKKDGGMPPRREAIAQPEL